MIPIFRAFSYGLSLVQKNGATNGLNFYASMNICSKLFFRLKCVGSRHFLVFLQCFVQITFSTTFMCFIIICFALANICNSCVFQPRDPKRPYERKPMLLLRRL